MTRPEQYGEVAKYDAWRDFLMAWPDDAGEVRMTFAEVEAIVGVLPPSAREHRTWWANDSKVQAAAWRAAGWRVDSVDQLAEQVVFRRGRAGGSRSAAVVAGGAVSALAPLPEAIDRPDLGVRDGMRESEVQASIVIHLVRGGWTIRHTADTATKEHGIDVIATREGRTLAIEVKGFPSRHYQDPRRAEQTKPTAPSTQARHWYAQALLKAMLTRSEHPDFDLAIGLPDAPTYRSLYRRTRDSLDLIGVMLLLVAPDGTVSQGDDSM
ncbi:hypothetical protein ACIBF5_21630 [Micromonospora sp. NPDC050417]|uniref:DUF7662 domain-containing protein n=1 Tax=Micromonospora sp. NPDC050417 TaxID=3364280 RepID=UPI0037AB1243